MSIQAPSLVEHLIAFAEQGNLHRVGIHHGMLYEGWIMEITDSALLISVGFSEKAGQDTWLTLNDIDLSTLSYWDTSTQQWTPYQLV